jgi:hypothetical protein
LSGCAVLRRPGGLALVTARPWRQHGELVDLPAAVIAAGAHAGLVPVARSVALLAGPRDERLIARPSFFELDNLRRARRHGHPWHLIVHEDAGQDNDRGAARAPAAAAGRAGRRRGPVGRDRVRVHDPDGEAGQAGPDDPPVPEAGRRLRAAARHAARTAARRRGSLPVCSRART